MGVDVRSGGVQVATALYCVGPLGMAYLSLVLKDVVDRWRTGCSGRGDRVERDLRPGGPGRETSAGTVFVVVVGILVALVIVWHAWKWPDPASETRLRADGPSSTPSGDPRPCRS